MKDHKRYSYFTKTGPRTKTEKPTEDPTSIGMIGNRPKWEIPDDVMDEMLAELREEENVSHE